MNVAIAPYGPADIEILRALVTHPSLVEEFRWLVPPGGLEDHFSDPYGGPELRRLARVDGEPVGFGFAFVPPAATGAFAMIRIGVLDAHRRRGLGTRLLETLVATLAPQRAARGLNELCVSARTPNPAAEAFAAHHGFPYVRTFWIMERPRDPQHPPVAAWPAGIEVRIYDGGEPALRDWTNAYNDAFADHFHYVRASLEHMRAFTRLAQFRPEGLVLAYRDGRCVGFCRNAVRGRDGEVALLGTVRAARGIGLGRALLRWSVAWLERQDVDSIELGVDGENDTALRLYRDEGFAVAVTRGFWAKAY
jgi:mycothiol synthase